MKKIKFLNIITVGIFLIYSGCRDSQIVELGDCKLEKIIKSVSDKKAIIWFDTQAQKHVVYSGIEGTYDCVDIGIPCNLPESYNTKGLMVLFSGNYYTCNEFSPSIPGETYYYLEITKIKRLSEE